MNDELRKQLSDMQKIIDSNKPSLDFIAQFAARPEIDVIQKIIQDMHTIEMQSGFSNIIEERSRRSSLVQAAIGPIDDLIKLEMLGLSSPFNQVIEDAKRRMLDYEAHFRLPDTSEIASLVENSAPVVALASIQRYMEDSASLKKAMEAMDTPWLDIQKSAQSISGFIELQGIGHALKAAPAFSNRLSEALRIALGDWRDRITWPEAIFTDLIARTDFYVARGLDLGLTNFPPMAFRESLNIAGLRGEPPILVEHYGTLVPSSDNEEEEEAFNRTNLAHDWLQRFETHVRRFIDEKMTAAYGPKWTKGKLPNGLYEQWQEKKRVAEQDGGAELPLIAYADFTDYVRIICRGDNWRDVFAPFFGRPESVRESFQRLYPIRICTMHARPITQEDELLLYVEVKRLIKAIL